MDNNSKYEFLTQLAVRMVDSIDGDMLQNNVARLAEFDEKGTSISPSVNAFGP